MSESASVFVSHSHEDNEWCRQFVDALINAGVDVWYDEYSWKTTPLLEELERQQRQRPNFIVILSHHAIRSPRVIDECTAALTLRYGDIGRVIVTVVAAPIDENEIPLYLRNYHRLSTAQNTPLPPVEAARRAIELLFPQLMAKRDERLAINTSGSISGYMRSTHYTRRLPVYLVLDTSDTMQGHAIVGINEGVSMIYRELISDPRTTESVYLSVLTFPAQVYHSPVFVPVDQFVPPYLSAAGPSLLGEAIHRLNESLEYDIIPSGLGEIKGDYRPMVFVLLGSHPIDDWRSEVRRLSTHAFSQWSGKSANIVGIGVGPNADMAALREMTNYQVFRLEEMTSNQLRGLFVWISGVIISRSVQ